MVDTIRLFHHAAGRSGRTLTFDCLLQSLMQRKRRLAEKALWPMGDSSNDVSSLTEAVAAPQRGKHMVIVDSMTEQFIRDGLPPVKPDSDGAYQLG